jgi:type IV pilus assembly protein PilV
MQLHTFSSYSPAKRRSQAGATLIEVLVTMFVVAVGLLGTAGLQLASTRFQQTSYMRSQALIEAQALAEKIRSNQAALVTALPPAPANAYLAANTYALAATLPADPGCGLAGQAVCTTQQAAQRDVREWRQSLLARLPEGRGSILPVAVGAAVDPIARNIVVMWREKQTNASNETDTDLADVGCPAAVVAGAGIRCFSMVVMP